jgi:hypothetical protein
VKYDFNMDEVTRGPPLDYLNQQTSGASIMERGRVSESSFLFFDSNASCIHIIR